MRRIWMGLALVCAFMAHSGIAEATNHACFDWSCNESTHVCTFDASCTTFTSGQLWRYRWDFGDGAGYFFTGSAITSNTYSIPYPTVTLTVVPFGADLFSVSCGIVVWNNIGPPRATYGRCQ
jgi:hypothetical protein